MGFKGFIYIGYSFCIIITSAFISKVINEFEIPLKKEATRTIVALPTVNFTFTDNNTCSGSEILFNAIASGEGTLGYSWEVRKSRPLDIQLQEQSNIDCEAQSIIKVFTAVPTGGVPPYQLTWSSGTVSGANNEVMTTNASGLVSIEVVDSIGSRFTRSIDVEIPVLGDTDFEVTSFGYINYGIFAMLDPIQFANTVIGDYDSVSWDFGDGSFSIEENPIHTYQRQGTYEVILTAHYPYGCLYTRTQTLEVVKGYNIIMPSAFTPNDDGINDFFGPEYIGLKNLELYIYDTWGSLIYSETGDVIRGWNGKIKGEPAENGNYHYVFRAHTIFEEPIQKKGAFTFIK